jgi:subtilase family serine protease
MQPIKSFQFVRQTKLHWLLFILLFSVACSPTINTAKPTPTPVPIAFSPVNLGIPADALNSPITGPLDPNTPMKVIVLFKLNQSQQNQLQKIPTNQEDLKKEANKIGITDAQYEQIKKHLGIENVTLQLNKLHTSVEVDGKAQTMARLFQTTFVNHKYQDQVFYAPKTPPLVPTQINQLIVSITGLDSYSPPMNTKFSAQAWHATTQSKAQASCQVPGEEVLPKDVAHAYGYDQFLNQGYRGKGLTINLVEIDGYPEADVANYGECVGYKGNITVKTIGPAPSKPGAETALDIEMIQGLAPEADIIDYQTGDSRYLVDELQQLIDDNTNNAGNGNVVSISLGGAENRMSSNYLNAIDQELSVLTNTEHMTVFIASGDCGAFTDRIYNSYTVSFPASDSYAVGVGGTVLQTDGNGHRTHEVVWAEENPNPLSCKNSWGSGGGNSRVFEQPNWQTGKGVQNESSRNARQVPDIAAVAFNLPVYFDGQWGAGAGTSAATPIWAAGMLLVNQKTIDKYHVFFAGPDVLYHIANAPGQFSPYFDITEGGGGSSATFKATSGWDFATGLGTPNLGDIYQILAAIAQQQTGG